MMKVKIKEGNIYAIHTGQYAGEMLIFVKSNKTDHCFLSIPLMCNRNIPIIVFERGLSTEVVKFVESAPPYVWEISNKQYIKNEDTHNRRSDSVKSSEIVESS